MKHAWVHECSQPVTGESFLNTPEDIYDDSPWTDEERMLLAWEAGMTAGWDEMDEYDDYPEGDLDPRDAYAAIDRAFAEGWDDPKMDDYDRYEEFKKTDSDTSTP